MKKKQAYAYLTLLLLIAFLAQEIFQIKSPWFERLQQDESYRFLSGFILSTYIAGQWYLSLLRIGNHHRAAKHYYKFHLWMGSLAPLFFYLHATEFGYAYLFLLSSVYFLVLIVGLCNQEVLKIRAKVFSYYWMITHVALSVLLLILMSYHFFIVLYYE